MAKKAPAKKASAKSKTGKKKSPPAKKKAAMKGSQKPAKKLVKKAAKKSSRHKSVSRSVTTFACGWSIPQCSAQFLAGPTLTKFSYVRTNPSPGRIEVWYAPSPNGFFQKLSPEETSQGDDGAADCSGQSRSWQTRNSIIPPDYTVRIELHNGGTREDYCTITVQ